MRWIAAVVFAFVVAWATMPAGANMAPPLDDFKLGVTLEPIRVGARVLTVIPGSPADRAGLKTGDVLLAIDRRYVRSYTKAEIRALADQVHTWPVDVIFVRGSRDVMSARVAP